MPYPNLCRPVGAYLQIQSFFQPLQFIGIPNPDVMSYFTLFCLRICGGDR